MLSCKEVVELLAAERLRDAPLSRRMALRLHLLMCRHCRAYRRALRRLGEAARRVYQGAAAAPEEIERVLDAVRRAAARQNPGL